jgi:hypothetical protein
VAARREGWLMPAQTVVDAGALAWYRRIVGVGIFWNLVFAFNSLYAPPRIHSFLHLRPLGRTIWLRNVGMLLVLVSMFNAGSLLNPMQYPLFSWMVPAARLIASFFFFRVAIQNPWHSSDRPKSFLLLAVFDGTFGLVCAYLLNRNAPLLQTLRSSFGGRQSP